MTLATPSLTSRMRLEDWFDRYQYSVTRDIGESAVQTLRVADLPPAAQDMRGLLLRYGHHQGLPELREAVAGLYPGLTADDVLITAGASEAIAVLAIVLLSPDSRAVIEHPTYPTLYRVPRGQRATVDLFRLRPEENWLPDWPRLRETMRGGADLLAITHPNNPIGSTINIDELRTAIGIAQDSRARLVSDETYGLMTDGDPLPPAASVDPSAVSISTMSKTFGLPGLRIGWIACRDADLMARLVSCREHITITNNTLGEHIALEVLRSAPTYVERAKERITHNRAIVAATVAGHPRLDWVAPTAGLVGLPWITGADEARCRDLYVRLAEDRKTLVIPGSGFDLPDTYFRIGFGGDPAELRAGLGQLVAALDELDNTCHGSPVPSERKDRPVPLIPSARSSRCHR